MRGEGQACKVNVGVESGKNGSRKGDARVKEKWGYVRETVGVGEGAVRWVHVRGAGWELFCDYFSQIIRYCIKAGALHNGL